MISLIPLHPASCTVCPWPCGSVDQMFSTTQAPGDIFPSQTSPSCLSNLCSLCVYYGNYCIFLKVFFFFSLNKIRSNLQCGVILCVVFKKKSPSQTYAPCLGFLYNHSYRQLIGQILCFQQSLNLYHKVGEVWKPNILGGESKWNATKEYLDNLL